MTCRNLSVKICTDQSNKVKTSYKRFHVAFCDNSFYCKISSDKLQRRSDKLIHVRSITLGPVSPPSPPYTPYRTSSMLFYFTGTTITLGPISPPSPLYIPYRTGSMLFFFTGTTITLGPVSPPSPLYTPYRTSSMLFYFTGTTITRGPSLHTL